MLVQNTNDNIIDCQTLNNRSQRAPAVLNSITVSTSPSKSRKLYLTRTTSFDRTHYKT